ncbi:MAG: 2TM domain-containing protein [Lewinellaceae bacterium]|nr:2TM domain-containing protein [Saprospiraceae bacterium]MCB9339215.1 2TM domain-containing protein [Lewinellaceae bacterium]
MYQEEEIRKARKKVKAKKEFYQHLMSFAIVNFFLFALNMITSPFNWWFQFPLLGWGVGLAFHYVEVFGIPGFDILSKEWEEREVEKELRKGELNAPVKNKRTTQEAEPEEMKLKELRTNHDESEFV